MSEQVNHPNHYKIPGRDECIVEMQNKFGTEKVLAFCELNAYKYRYRYELKNGQEDLKKADWYDHYAEKLKGSEEKIYEVKKGDCLMAIAKKFESSEMSTNRMLQEIIKVNGFNDVMNLEPGMKLIIPKPESISRLKRYIADHYGWRIQSQQLIEEMAELTQVICKEKRSRGEGQSIGGTWLYSDIKKHLIEEIADVKLMLEQVIYLLGVETDIKKVINKKVRRTMERISRES